VNYLGQANHQKHIKPVTPIKFGDFRSEDGLICLEGSQGLTLSEKGLFHGRVLNKNRAIFFLELPEGARSLTLKIQNPTQNDEIFNLKINEIIVGEGIVVKAGFTEEKQFDLTLLRTNKREVRISLEGSSKLTFLELKVL